MVSARALVVGLALLAACARPPSHEQASASAATSAHTPTQPAATARFCAYGGVGIVPDPLPPGYDTSFAVAVFEVTTPSPITSVAVRDFVLLDRHGAVTASMKRIDRMVDLGTATRAPAPNDNGSWAFYMNPAGSPFGGTLAAGTTRLRVRVALDHPPVEPARFRVTLTHSAAPIVVEGPVNGAWPT